MTKKRDIIQAAPHLFTDQGFDGTTTVQMIHEASIFEPLKRILFMPNGLVRQRSLLGKEGTV